MITFQVLERSMSCCAIAYAVSAVARVNPSLYAHADDKTGDQKSFLKNFRGVISRDPAEVHERWVRNTRNIYKGRYVDPDLLKTWVLHASPNSKPWLYFPDQDVVKNYNLEPIGGLLGNAKYHAPVLLAVIATRKNHEVRDETVYIAFKGTQGGLGLASVITAWLFNKVLSEWSTNMSFKLVKDDQGYFPGLVHEGFLNAFRSFQKHLDKFLSDNNNIPVVVTGHSLGGALAVLTAYYLKKCRPYLNVSLVTFAEPNVGDAMFVNAVEELLKCKIFSYYLEGDFCKFKFPGYEPLSSAMDVSKFLGNNLGLTAIKAHYFEGIRLALYIKNEQRLTYRPIIRELRFDKICDNPKKLLMNFLPPTIRNNIEMFDQTLITGITFVRREEFKEIFQSLSLSHSVQQMFALVEQEFMVMEDSSQLLNYFYQLAKKEHEKPGAIGVRKCFLVIFYFSIKIFPSIKISVSLKKSLEEFLNSIEINPEYFGVLLYSLGLLKSAIEIKNFFNMELMGNIAKLELPENLFEAISSYTAMCNTLDYAVFLSKPCYDITIEDALTALVNTEIGKLIAVIREIKVNDPVDFHVIYLEGSFNVSRLFIDFLKVLIAIYQQAFFDLSEVQKTLKEFSVLIPA